MAVSDSPETSPTALESPPGGWPRPTSLYLHVPFCRRRCGYCNFSVVANRDDLVDRYLAAVDRELETLQHPYIDTLFVGGGTPTHLNASHWRRLVASVRRHLVLAEDLEFSVEANPENFNHDGAEFLADLGVNRISLGVQSFDPAKLDVLERGHRGEQAITAVEAAAGATGNVSIDLIFASPGETLATWISDVDAALCLPIQHLSTYALTFEKGTLFWNRQQKGQLEPSAEDQELAMFNHTREATAAAGWTHYEISNFALPNHRCRHNLAYWTGRGWYAVGPGAASFHQGRREVNHRSTTTYLKRMESQQSPIAESERISLLQYASERLAFGLRMTEGVDLVPLSRETGLNVNELFAEPIERLREQGLLAGTGSQLKLTPRGILFADTVASEFLA